MILIYSAVKEGDMAEHVNKKRPSDENDETTDENEGDDQVMPDQKRPREENEQHFIWQPDTAGNGISTTDLEYNEIQAPQSYSSSINYISLLREREFVDKIRKLANIYRGYHLRTFGIRMREIEEEFTDSGFEINEFQLVLAEDVINVIKVFNNETCIVPFSRQAADQISVFTDDNGIP